MKKSPYASMNISELSRLTRERGLKKPAVRTRADWIKFLDGDDAKRAKVSQAVEPASVEVVDNAPDGDRDTEDAPKTSEAADTDPDIDTLKVSKRTKGRS